VLRKAGTVPEPKAVDLLNYDDQGTHISPAAFRKETDPGAGGTRHQVQHVRPLTSSTYVLRIDRQELSFEPGQYVNLSKEGSVDAREYTIYSSVEDDFLEFLITQVDGGKVSNALRACGPGDGIIVDGPMGYFRIVEVPPASRRPYCFIATGSGIAPFRSFVRSYPDLDYRVLHGVRHTSDCYDRDTYAPERYISCVSRQAGGDFQGRVTDYLRQHPVAPETICYLCGNCNMLFGVYDLLVQQGIPHKQIRTEVFY
jgi:ferredoxin--NADP+ reductase/benzoate/toluate 1,2-dioxygenase reductase subunit